MTPIGPFFECIVSREWNCLKRLEGLGGVALLEELCHCKGALRFQSPDRPSLTWPADQNVALSYCSITMLPAMMIID